MTKQKHNRPLFLLTVRKNRKTERQRLKSRRRETIRCHNCRLITYGKIITSEDAPTHFQTFPRTWPLRLDFHGYCDHDVRRWRVTLERFWAFDNNNDNIGLWSLEIWLLSDSSLLQRLSRSFREKWRADIRENKRAVKKLSFFFFLLKRANHFGTGWHYF